MTGPILQVVTDTDRRGAQVFAADLHHALGARGLDVRTVALAEGAVGGLDWPVLGPARKHPSTVKALHQEARRAAVVVAHGSTTLPLCAITRVTARVPFVYRQISESTFWANSAARRWRVRGFLALSTRVVALWDGSAATLEGTFGVASRKIRVIPNGVPVDRFPPVDRDRAPAARVAFGLDPERPTILSLGALVPEKGVDLAVRAVAKIIDAQLLVAGDGPDRAALERLATEVAPGRVFFAGSVREPRQCFEAADVVVLPSRGGDSMPAVLIEAGLMGIPMVATPVDGIVEITDHGRAGELVAPGDVDALAAALERVLTDEALANDIAAKARRHCLGAYDIDIVAQQWAQVIEELPASQRRTGA